MAAQRAREDSVRPRRLLGTSGRPLNFTSKDSKDFTVLSTAFSDFWFLWTVV